MGYLLLILLSLMGFFAAVGLWGRYRWQASSRLLYATLTTSPLYIEDPIYHEQRDLQNLPPAVQQYFRTVLTDGQPLIREVNLRQQGTFNLSEDSERWRPFRARQHIVAARPGFCGMPVSECCQVSAFTYTMPI